MTILFSSAGFTLLQRILISKKIKNVIFTKLDPVLNADKFNISEIDLDLKYININDITFKRGDIDLRIENVRLAYSPINLWQKGINFKALVDQVWISDIHLDLLVSDNQDKDFDWKFEVSRYQKLIRKVKDFAYLDSIRIRNFNTNAILYNNLTLPLLKDMEGTGVFSREMSTLDFNLCGYFNGNSKKNVTLTGLLNYSFSFAYFNLNINKSAISLPFLLREKIALKQGFYQGKINLAINKEQNGLLELTGSLNLDKVKANIAGVNIDSLSTSLSILNSEIYLDTLTTELNFGSLFSSGLLFSSKTQYPQIKGFIENLNFSNHLPDGLTYTKPSISFTLQKSKDSLKTVKSFLDNVNLNINVICNKLKYYNQSLENIKCLLSWSNSSLSIDSLTFLKNKNYFMIKGYSTDYEKGFFNIYSSGNLNNFFPKNLNLPYLKQGNYDLKAKFSLDFLPSDILSSLNLNGGISLEDSYYDVNLYKRKLSFSDRKTPTNVKFTIDLNKNLNFDLDIGNCKSFLTNNLRLPSAIEDFVLKNNQKLSIRAYGNKENQHFIIKHENPYLKHMTSGNIVGILENSNLGKKIRLNFLPDSLNIMNKTLGTEIIISDSSISCQRLRFGNKDYPLYFNYNFKKNHLALDFLQKNFNFGKVLNFQALKKIGFTTRSNIQLKLNGSIDNLAGYLAVQENSLRVNNNSNLKKITGDIFLSLNKNIIRVDMFKFSYLDETLINVVGVLENLEKYNLSSYGNFNIANLYEFLPNELYKNLKGKFSYLIEGKGQLDDFSLDKIRINIDSLKYGSLVLSKSSADLTYKDKLISIKKGKIQTEDEINAEFEGLIPLKDSESIDIKLEFQLDIFSYLNKVIPYYVSGQSFAEGMLIFSGNYSKPQIEDFNMYFLAGKYQVSNITEPLTGLKGKISLDDNKYLTVKDLTAYDSNGNRLIINSFPASGKFITNKLPFGLKIDILGVSAPDGGIKARVPGAMRVGEYGLLQPKGLNGDNFFVGMYKSGIAFEGQGLIRSSKFTFPLSDESTFPGSPSNTEGNAIINLDMLLTPVSGNYFFYGGIIEESSIWDKLKSAFSYEKNKTISNLEVQLASSDRGVHLLGNTESGIRAYGEIEGRAGRVSYAALDFEIEEARVLFDGGVNSKGYQDPFLSGICKTKVRSNADSTGFAEFETIKLKIVTKNKKGEIINYDGGRLSNYQILLLDESGNPWSDRIQETIEKVGSEATANAIFNQAIDSRFFRPLLSPVENILGTFLNAYVSIRPNITENLRNDDFSNRIGYRNYTNIFEGSELFISKFLTDNLAISLSSRYLGADRNIEIDKYGFENSLGFDYKLNQYLYTSIGYKIDTLSDTEGYNLGLKYRYRFENFNTSLKNLNLYLRRKKEKLLMMFE